MRYVLPILALMALAPGSGSLCFDSHGIISPICILHCIVYVILYVRNDSKYKYINIRDFIQNILSLLTYFCYIKITIMCGRVQFGGNPIIKFCGIYSNKVVEVFRPIGPIYTMIGIQYPIPI